MNSFNIRSWSDEDLDASIEKLKTEAEMAGDWKQVTICKLALGELVPSRYRWVGNHFSVLVTGAREACIEVIQDAYDADDDDEFQLDLFRDIVETIEAYADDHNTDRPTDVTVLLPRLRAAVQRLASDD